MRKIRLRYDRKAKITVCKHIDLLGAIRGEKYDESEYKESLNMWCKRCKKDYKFEILVN